MKIRNDFSRPKDLNCNYCLSGSLFAGLWNEMLGKRDREREKDGERETERIDYLTFDP